MATDATRYFHQSGFRFVPVQAEHAQEVEDLEPIHADPLDRLLVALAQVEPMRLLSADATVARYGEMLVRV